ncbi:MAG: TatD family hydrolase [Bacteroidaceae bacterium]|nr:TatD family hydrolase [Bacteroidaceae bacterium]
MNFHTHDLNAPLPAIINIPLEWMLHPEQAELRADATYSVGIHPWWTEDENINEIIKGFYFWATHPQVIRIGECGIDKLRGATEVEQERIFTLHIELAEKLHKPLTIHCVKAFDRILALHKQLHPTQRWCIHGFRGKPELAQQLLATGIDLSFGVHYNEEAYALCPKERRFRETD